MKSVVVFLSILAVVGILTLNWNPADQRAERLPGDEPVSLRAGTASAPLEKDALAEQPVSEPHVELATFGAGCFWCVEAVFRELEGVSSVVSGYSGGSPGTANYKSVCTGNTDHAEVAQIQFDPTVITFDELLEVFWQTHDPTTLNRQGFDEGPQYRSVIFAHTDQQEQVAQEYKRKLNEAGAFDKPIVTEITRFDRFYPAEEYHQDYYQLNSSQPYCAAVIRPKLEKLRKVFRDKLKSVDADQD